MTTDHDSHDQHPDHDHLDPLADGALVEGMFTDIAVATKTPPKWVVNNLVPVGLVILGAPPKSNKSTLAMTIAAQVAGLDPQVLPPDLNEVPHTGGVIVFSYEAMAGELRFMLEEGLHVTPKEDGSILVADDPWAWRLDDEEKVTQLKEILTRRQPRLVILDTFRDMHDQEEKDSGLMVKMLRPLREWAVAEEAAVILVHHTVKLNDETPIADARHLRGSGAIFGKADGVLMMTRRPDETHVINATFKRAESWTRTLKLGIYGNKIAGSEPLTDSDILVLDCLKKRLSLEAIAEQLHRGKAFVVQTCGKLSRNGYLAKTKDGKWKPTEKEVVQ